MSEKSLPPDPKTVYVANDFEEVMRNSLDYHLSNARVGVEKTLSLPPCFSEAVNVDEFIYRMGEEGRIKLRDDHKNESIDVRSRVAAESQEIIYSKIIIAIANLFQSDDTRSLRGIIETISYIEIRIECSDDAEMISNDDIRVYLHPYGEVDCIINDEDIEDEAIFAAPDSESELN